MNPISSAIYAMLAACMLPFLWSAVAKMGAGFNKQDNHNPRQFLAQLSGWPARANAVSLNGFESLPMFLAAVLAAFFTAVSPANIEILAWCYVGLRITYGIAYLADLATVRSIIWTMSMACPLILFVKAASNLNM